MVFVFLEFRLLNCLDIFFKVPLLIKCNIIPTNKINNNPIMINENNTFSLIPTIAILNIIIINTKKSNQ